MKTFALLFLLLAGAAFGASGPDVLRPKMSFREAFALLQKHHAKATTLQIEYPDGKTNRRIEHFILTDDRTIEVSLIREKERADWTIKAIFEVVWPRPEQSRGKEWRELPELNLGQTYGLTLDEGLQAIRSATLGAIAFCKPSLIDELQIIGSPRELSAGEVKALTSILGALDTYISQTGARASQLHSLCDPYWNFKILLSNAEGDTLISLRLCSSCHQLAFIVNGEPVDCPDFRQPAMTALAVHLDSWFPGWAETTQRNRNQWEAESYRRSRKKRDAKE